MKKLQVLLNNKVAKTGVVLGALMGSSSAFAALPAEATTALTSVTDFADSMIAAAWPIVGTITVATIGIKLFKKFTNKAT